MRRFVIAVGVLAALASAGVAWWRRHRRFGTQFVNRIVNPLLIRRRLAGSGRSEIGTIEHFGRTTGIRRWTPVHPEPTADGFRIIVPLGQQSEWAKNVLAAGHCRVQLHDRVYELDEPRLISPTETDGLPAMLRRLETALGFRYLAMRRFADAPGRLDGEYPVGREVVPARPDVANAEHTVETPKPVATARPPRARSRSAATRHARAKADGAAVNIEVGGR